MGYRIGSFNMYKFQAYRSDSEINKNLERIASIIKSEKFDIVALQEIFSKMAMLRLLKSLGSDWSGYWDSPNSRSVQAAEGYAFIWNKKRIKLAESLTVNGKRTFYPRIYNQYRVDKQNGQCELVRNPFYGRFNPIGQFIEIRLINAHIMFKKNNGKEYDDTISTSDARLRIKELDILIKNILCKEDDKRYGNNMPAYTILLGDYNLNLKREWTKWPYLQEVILLNEGVKDKKILTVQDQLTTLKNRSRSAPDEPVRGYSNNYDHFTYDENRFSGVGIKYRKIDSVRKYYKDDFELHKKEVSDHVPIIMTLNLKNNQEELICGIEIK